jgi:cbb3-type cytochrome oxidase cytochrome c subunit
MILRRCIFFLVTSIFSVALAARAQVDPKLYSDMKWREIGPMRAGRTRALACCASPKLHPTQISGVIRLS